MAKFVEELEHLELTTDQEVRLHAFLSEELHNSIAERSSFIQNLQKEITAYEAPDAEEKSHPWVGAAKLTVPLIGTMADAVFPRLHSTVFGTTNLITVEEFPGELAEHAKAWEDMLQWIMVHELDIERVSNSWIMEAVVHGTSIVKIFWERLEKETISYNPDGEIVKRDRKIIKNRPVIEHIPLEDFYIPYNATSIDSAQWVAHRIHTTFGELKLREENGLYKNIDDISPSTEAESPAYRRTREELEETEPHSHKNYDVYEVWVDFDLDGKGHEVPLLVTYHLPTATFLRVQAHPYNHQKRPFAEIIYFPRADRFYGIGLAHQLMPLQDEITAIHRQRLDNSTIANTKMWKIKAGSRADQSFQGVAPSLKILVDDQDEMEGVELGSVGSDTFENERMALTYAQQRAGLPDFMGGTDGGKTGGRQTATQSVANAQEARTKFNWSLEQIRSAMSKVAIIVTELYAQFGIEDSEKFTTILGPDKGRLVLELLSDDGVELSNVLSLQVTASSATSNKSLEQQQLIALSQLLQQQTLNFELPLIQLIQAPETPDFLKEYAKERIEGSRILMRRILETADVRNTTQILGNTETLQKSEQDVAPPPVAPAALPGPAGPGPADAGLNGLAALGGPPSGGLGLGG